MAWNQSAYTAAGVGMLTETLAGRRLSITRAAGGMGTCEASKLGNLTDVVGEQIALGLLGITDTEAEDDDGTLVPAKQVGTQITNEGLVETRILHQVGVYGKLDTDDTEHMIYVLQDERGIELPSESDNPSFAFDLYVNLLISHKSNIVLKVESGGKVTLAQVQGMIEDHDADAEAHTVIIQQAIRQAVDQAAQQTSGKIDKAVASHNDDPTAHSTIIAEAVSKEVSKMAEGGSIVTSETMEQAVEKQVDKALASMPAGSYYGYLDLTIPATGWTEADEPSADHNYTCDVAADGVTGELIPIGGPKLGSYDVANTAGVAPGCETLDGAVRFFSREVPEGDISAYIILLTQGQEGGGSAGVEAGQGLAYQDGRLNVNIGEGLTVDEQNKLTVDKGTVMTEDTITTPAETGAMLDEVFDS